jgi:hypothetical protein
MREKSRLETNTAIAHLRDVLGDPLYELLAHEGETMTTAAMATYADDQIDQARAELNAVSKQDLALNRSVHRLANSPRSSCSKIGRRNTSLIRDAPIEHRVVTRNGYRRSPAAATATGSRSLVSEATSKSSRRFIRGSQNRLT